MAAAVPFALGALGLAGSAKQARTAKKTQKATEEQAAAAAAEASKPGEQPLLDPTLTAPYRRRPGATTGPAAAGLSLLTTQKPVLLGE